ncbi:MAG: glycolate oxidase subunit GlcD, partial [Proteobacteria bacterium]|nr:glycolate oxidase subunit GlcD [Pseudomonadota bacterium]
EGANKWDLCVPMSKINLFLKKIKDYDTKDLIYNFGHLGDGNIHVNILLDEDGVLADKIYRLLQDFDGSPSAEHGIGKRKTKLLKEFTNYQDKLYLLKHLKNSVDPANILGPKVFFED